MERASGSMSPNIGIKIAGLWKRSQGLSWINNPNYKHRVFILTDQALAYYSGTVDRIGQLKGRIPLENVRAVEFVSESAFNLAHMFQVVYVTKKHGYVTLYVIGRDKSECADWVACLRNACYFNQDMLMHYHPGIVLKNNWTCCQQLGKNALGCQPTFHLLTRSSSRYAQMRRKDTLNLLSSRRSSKKETKTTDTLTLRRSTVCAQPEESELTGGLRSNSCEELASCVPNDINTLARSERSCLLSADNNAVTELSYHRASASEFSADYGLERPCNFSAFSGTEHQKCASLSSIGLNDCDTEQRTTKQVAVSDDSYMNEQVAVSDDSYMNEQVVVKYEGGFLVTRPVVVMDKDGGTEKVTTMQPISLLSTPEFTIGASMNIHSGTLVMNQNDGKTFLHANSNRSSGGLCRPVIEPKISNSDPTVFHV